MHYGVNFAQIFKPPCCSHWTLACVIVMPCVADDVTKIKVPIFIKLRSITYPYSG